MCANPTLCRRNLRIVRLSKDDTNSQLIRKRMGISVSEFIHSLERTESVTARSIETSRRCFVWPKHTINELFDSSKPTYQYAADDISLAIRFRALGCYHASTNSSPQSDTPDLQSTPLTHSTPPCQRKLPGDSAASLQPTSLGKDELCRNQAIAEFQVNSNAPPLTISQQHQLAEDLQLSESEEEDLDATRPMREDDCSHTSSPDLVQKQDDPSWTQCEARSSQADHFVGVSEALNHLPSFVSPLSVMGECEESLTLDEPVVNEVVVRTESKSRRNTRDLVSYHEDSRSPQTAQPPLNQGGPVISQSAVHPDESITNGTNSPALMGSDHQGCLSSSPAYFPKSHRALTNLRSSDPSLFVSNIGYNNSTNFGYIQRLIAESASVLSAKQNCFVPDLSPSHTWQRFSTDSSSLPPGKENRRIENSLVESYGTNRRNESNGFDPTLSSPDQAARKSPFQKGSSEYSLTQPEARSSAATGSKHQDRSKTAANSPTLASSPSSLVTDFRKGYPTQCEKFSDQPSQSTPNQLHVNELDMVNQHTRPCVPDARPSSPPRDRAAMPPPPDGTTKVSRRHENSRESNVTSIDMESPKVACVKPVVEVCSALRSTPEKRWVFSGLALTKVRSRLQQLHKQFAHSQGLAAQDSCVNDFRSVLECSSSISSNVDKDNQSVTVKPRSRPLTGVLLIPTHQNTGHSEGSASCAVVRDAPIKPPPVVHSCTNTSPICCNNAGTQCDPIIEPPIRDRDIPSGSTFSVDHFGINSQHLVFDVLPLDSHSPHSSVDSNPEVHLQLSSELKNKASRCWKALVNAISKKPSVAGTSPNTADRGHLLLTSNDLHTYPVYTLQMIKHVICAIHLFESRGEMTRCQSLLDESISQLSHVIHRLQRVESKLVKARVRNMDVCGDTNEHRIRQDASWLQLWYYGLNRLRAVLRYHAYRLRSREDNTLKSKLDDDLSTLNGDVTSQATDRITVSKDILERLIQNARLNHLMQEAMDDWERSDTIASKVPCLMDSESTIPLDTAISDSTSKLAILNRHSNLEHLPSYMDGLIRMHSVVLNRLRSGQSQASSDPPPTTTSKSPTHKVADPHLVNGVDDLHSARESETLSHKVRPQRQEKLATLPEHKTKESNANQISTAKKEKLSRKRKLSDHSSTEPVKKNITPKNSESAANTHSQSSVNTNRHHVPVDECVKATPISSDPCKVPRSPSDSRTVERMPHPNQANRPVKVEHTNPNYSVSTCPPRERRRSKSLAPSSQSKSPGHQWERSYLSPPHCDKSSDKMYYPKRIRLTSNSTPDGSDSSSPIPCYKPSKAPKDDVYSEKTCSRNARAASVGRSISSLTRDDTKCYSPTRPNLVGRMDPVPVYHVSRISPDHRANGFAKSSFESRSKYHTAKQVHRERTTAWGGKSPPFPYKRDHTVR